MRIAALILAALGIALAAAVLLPLFSQPATARLAREPELLAMMVAAPLEAEQVIAVPTFAATWRRFAPLIGPLAESRASARSLSAASWAIGNAPVAIWTTDSGWGALARPDAMHRMLLRLGAPFISTGVAFEDGRVRFGGEAPGAGRPVDAGLAGPLEGHLFILHGDEGSYPPMERPALTAVRLEDGILKIVTRGRAAPGEGAEPIRLGGKTLPANALLAARFAEPPRAVVAMEKAAPIRFGRFLREGTMVALYGAEDAGLVPRPLIAFSVPADDEAYRQMVAAVDRALAKGAVGLLLGAQPERTRTIGGVTVTHREGLGLTMEYARRNGEMLFAFDDASLERLLEAGEAPAGNGRASWALRARPLELLPVLHELGSSRGLRLLARGFSDAARDMEKTLRALPPSEELTAQLEREGEFVVLTAEARIVEERRE